jgi:2-hydroxychromene-2-carboxylate isomerase
MKQITFYLDFISPYAYLAFEALPQALIGQSYAIAYKPVLFAGMLKHYGQLGPAEIVPKRIWTYQQVLWLGRQQKISLDLPSHHPFNPLALLRLAIACSGNTEAPDGMPNRWVCETIFRHVWQGGLNAEDPVRIQALSDALSSRHDRQADPVKSTLQKNTLEAIEKGVFGVPTFCVDDQLFWGHDALPMLRAYLAGDPWFLEGSWAQAQHVLVGETRRKTSPI